MSIESLKQQARRHEQKEEWQKALDQYKKALTELSKDDQTDIGLINRVGDLFVRVGSLDQAVEHYEQAVDLYREAFLPNNAIAVCKKIIRNVPDRHQAYLKIGQIRAEQGFLPDARTNFLTYAERMQQDGDLDESFRALVEFCDLAPDDVDVRITVADQMAASQRTEEAVEQLTVAYRQLTHSGEADLAAGVETKILALDPGADLGAALAMAEAGMGSTLGDDGEIEAQFGEIDLGGDSLSGFGESEPDEAEPQFALDSEGSAAGDEQEAGLDVLSAAADALTESLEDASEEEVELPIMGFEGDDEEDGDGEPVELPMMGFEDDDTDEEEAGELPTIDFGDDSEPAESEELDADFAVVTESPSEVLEDEPEATSEPPTDDFQVESTAADEGDWMVSDDDLSVEAGADPHDAEGQSDRPTAAEALEDAVEDAIADIEVAGGAIAFEPPAPEPPPEPSPPPAVEAPPAAPPTPPAEPPTPEQEPAAEDDYVDFGAMILGTADEKSTRFKVAYEEPTGDEEADFAKMLTQFKEKVSENLDSGDVRAHYDLGTAYKEMGLLEEAISSFQAALRASAEHLPTYELMGQTFIEMGQAEAAVKTLQRALQIQAGVEDEFVGIYYYLARAYESLHDRDSAVEYYDRVFALDINFADVTERLRELR